MLLKLATFAAAIGLASAAPADKAPAALQRRGFDCSAPVNGLSQEDCQHMSNIGMAGQGKNDFGNNGNIWIGNDGPSTFTFTNDATNPSPVPVTIIVWYNAPYDYQSSFMNVRTPMVSYSLPNIGDKVTISLADGVSGGFAALNNHETTLSQYGQIFNTWGEFTSGQYGTFDVSREVNMGGNVISARTAGGCLSDMETCVFKCKNGNSCGESQTYDLVNCDNGSQPGASLGYYDNNPSGGCQAWNGHIDISLGRY